MTNIASEVKLALSPIIEMILGYFVRAAGIKGESIRPMALYEIDRQRILII